MTRRSASKPSVLGLIMRHEVRVVIADRTLPVICALFAGLLLYGFATGLHETRQRDQVVAELVEAQDKKNAANVERWRRVMTGQEPADPFSNPVDPASVGGGLGAQYAILPTLPLSPVASGQSDMLADYFRVTYDSRASFMEEGEIESPWKLLSGQFDLAFVLIYLFPLLIFAISYNMLSIERDQGTLRMLLSQPLSLSRLMLAKIAVRAGVLFAVAALVPAIALVVTRGASLDFDAVGLLALWMLLIVAYGAFWFALTALMNAFGRSSAANALILIGAWVLLVLVTPVALNLAVSAASPAPSRTELATQTRLVTIDGLNQYNDLLSADYRYAEQGNESLLPKNGRLEVSARMRGFYAMDAYVDAKLEALLARFDRQLAGQQALVDRFGIVSPAIIASEGMASLAGNGSRRYERFQKQVVAYHADWRAFFVPRVNEGVAITEADFARLPRWTWREQSPTTTGADALVRIGELLLAAMMLTALAFWRFRRRSQI